MAHASSRESGDAELSSARKASSVWSGSAEPVGLEERIKHLAAPDVAHAQLISQQAFAAEPEFLDQCTRRGIFRNNKGLHAVQAEFAEQRMAVAESPARA